MRISQIRIHEIHLKLITEKILRTFIKKIKFENKSILNSTAK